MRYFTLIWKQDQMDQFPKNDSRRFKIFPYKQQINSIFFVFKVLLKFNSLVLWSKASKRLNLCLTNVNSLSAFSSPTLEIFSESSLLSRSYVLVESSMESSVFFKLYIKRNYLENKLTIKKYGAFNSMSVCVCISLSVPKVLANR